MGLRLEMEHPAAIGRAHAVTKLGARRSHIHDAAALCLHAPAEQTRLLLGGGAHSPVPTRPLPNPECHGSFRSKAGWPALAHAGSETMSRGDRGLRLLEARLGRWQDDRRVRRGGDGFRRRSWWCCRRPGRRRRAVLVVLDGRRRTTWGRRRSGVDHTAHEQSRQGGKRDGAHRRQAEPPRLVRDVFRLLQHPRQHSTGRRLRQAVGRTVTPWATPGPRRRPPRNHTASGAWRFSHAPAKHMLHV